MPQKHTNVTNMQMAKDHSLLILIWVLREFLIEKQYDGAMELEAQLSISGMVPKLPGLSVLFPQLWNGAYSTQTFKASCES